MMDVLCPICKSGHYKKISDDFFLCSSCSIIYNIRHTPAVYSDEYFGEEYKGQYGKTYEEDFEAIYAASVLRLQKIKQLLSHSPSHCNVLDIGCALGFFCKAAQDEGFGDVEGLEVSEFAARFCMEKYGIPVHLTGFETFVPQKQYDVITAWFVIEHFKDPRAIIQKIYTMLKPNGVFACTMPSYFGPLYCRHRDEWIQTHPLDHRIDVAPWSIRRLLKTIGFTQVHCFPSGYHPERCGKIALRYNNVYRLIADFLCFSDTLLVIAKKP